MATNEKAILEESIQSVVMALGREQNAIEFYNYLSETIPVEKAKQFFKEMALRETEDYEELERFLEKLKKEDEGVNKS